MRISELINQLEQTKKEFGDIHVFTQVSGFGGRAVYTCIGPSKWTEKIYPNQLLEHMSLDTEEIKKLFPNYNGDEESLETMEETAIGVAIESGDLIYST